MARSRAGVDVELTGNSRGAQQAIADTGKSLGKLSTLSSKASDEIGKAFGGTKLGALAAKSQSLFGGIGKSAASTGLLIGAGIGGGIAAAGVGLAKFAISGVDAFQKTALAAGKFSDATGLSVQQSSKYLEVSHDLGISAETFQGAFVKMEKSLASNRAAFGDLVATTKSGGVDLNQTFLNVITHIQGIKDPLERAKESAALFGRGFAEVSEVINTSATDIQSRLAAVRDEQIINPQELEQARKYRDAMNELGDSFEALQIAAGQRLVPALAGLAQKGADLLDIFNQLTTKDYGSTVAKQSDVIDEATKRQQAYNQEVNTYKNSVGEGAGAARRFIDIQNDYTGSAKAAADATKAEADAILNLAKAADNLLGATTNVDRAQQDFIDKMKALGDAQIAASKGGKDQADKMRTLRIAIDDAKDSAQSLAQANLKQAETQAAATGKTLTAQQENKILSDTYRALAGTAKGPVADALRGTAFLLDAVGRKKPNPTVNANIKPAKLNLADVQRAADAWDKRRASATLGADGRPAQNTLALLLGALAQYDIRHVDATLAAVDYASPVIARVRDRLSALNHTVANAVIHVTTTGTHIAPGVGAFAEGGMVPGPIGKPVPAIVHGGEIVIPNRGALSSEDGSRVKIAGGGGPNIVLNFYGPVMGTAQQFQDIVHKALLTKQKRVSTLGLR